MIFKTLTLGSKTADESRNLEGARPYPVWTGPDNQISWAIATYLLRIQH